MSLSTFTTENDVKLFNMLYEAIHKIREYLISYKLSDKDTYIGSKNYFITHLERMRLASVKEF